MKKILKIFIMALIISLVIITVSFANDKKIITSVSVTGIEAPYSDGRQIDTDGKVPNNATYRITNVSWKTPSESISGYYEVTVTLKANIGFIFSGDTVATINGEGIIRKNLEKDDELNITYAFDDNSSTAGTINASTSNIIYRITVYCDKEMGSITPALIRVSKGRNQTVHITPKEGYKIKDVKIDGESVGSVSEYTFKRVDEDHTVRAYFEKVEDNENKQIKPMLSILLNLLKEIL